MAAKKRTETRTVIVGDVTDETKQAAQAESKTDDELIRGLVELGGGVTGGVRWHITRLQPFEKSGYCGQYTDGDISLDRIQNDFGGGRYRVRAIDGTGKIIGGNDFNIQDKPKSLQEKESPAMPGLADPMVQMMMNMQKSQTDMLMGILNAMMQRPQSASGDPIETYIKLKALETKGPSEMDLFLKGLEFGREFGGGGGETNWLDLLGQGIKHVGPLLSAGIQPRLAQVENAAPVRAIPSQPINSIEVAPSALSDSEVSQRVPAAQQVERLAQSNNAENPMLKLLGWLKKQIDALVWQASKGKNPTLYAEVFVDNLPDFIPKQEMLMRMKRPDALEQLAQINGNVAAFPEWFGIFRDAVVQMLENDQSPPEQTENKNG